MRSVNARIETGRPALSHPAIYRKHGVKKGEARPALGKKFGIELTRSGRKQTTNDQIPKPMKAS